ncbi:CD209 antigen-like protein C [Onychostoma macrolepis]|uniref:CD209 antigen-like protein C n=1 Tax=Onychostoma macrolepis TaxID=369639 RepID=UPI00272D1E67|nr:CD209 antigen-like protein C [Onychostoma macrolepis]
MSKHVNYGMDKDSIMDSEDRIEKMVDIYVSAEAVRDMKHKKDKEDFDIQTPQHTGSDSVKVRNYRAAVVCLVLLCVLLLTAVIVLCVTLTQERQQFISKNENLTNERDQLRNQLHTYARWTCYKSTYYYMSSEKMNWTESRRYCTERGADLIIINNSEEEEFVKSIYGDAAVYIGLTDSDQEGSWKWVDGTLASGFSSWVVGEPNVDNRVDEDCAVAAAKSAEWPNLVGWLDVACNRTFQWICEKRTSQFMLP